MSILDYRTPLIRAVQAVKAVQRIPKPQRVTYFSENDLWLFNAVMDTKVCQTCRIAERIEVFRGNNLRLNFPNLKILDINTIGGSGPNGTGLVHPNCRCFLVRVIGEQEKV